mmetsp:Transcript_9030/g.13670  ORF Transcript_9030/g.13670 Transcript_9030/m.13670 type:complete len:429 (-) Transcript_9030:113-1399(-)
MTLDINLNSYVEEIPEADLLAAKQMAGLKGKRRSSEMITHHLLTSRGPSATKSTRSSLPSLRLSGHQSKSQPILSYTLNGLKRNKSNEAWNNISENPSFGLVLRRNNPQSSLAGTNQVLGSPLSTPVLSLSHPRSQGGGANASFSFVQHKIQTNPLINSVLNSIREDLEPDTTQEKTLASQGKVISLSLPDLDSQKAKREAEKRAYTQCALELKEKQTQKQQQAHALTRGHGAPQENSQLFQTKIKLDGDCHPQTTLISILQEAGFKAQTRKSSEMKDFFLLFTDDHIAAYDQEVVSAIRSKNIPLLRELLKNGKSLQCANRYGESLVHMACRRGHTEVVRFLIKEANVTLRVKDDYGRTPLHDACWSAEPNFELMDLLMEHEADLLLVEDSRGHFPFSYARRNHWKPWSEFLLARREKSVCGRLSSL